MKKASIIGFGDVRRGDLCVGSCVIEALEHEEKMKERLFSLKAPKGLTVWGRFLNDTL